MASTSPIHIKLTDFGISKSTINTKLRTRIGTEGYIAPEILGILPQSLNLGGVYTNAVDMWALGCLVYKIYTLETPFLERPSTTLVSETSVVVEALGESTDMDLLYNFCNGDIDLPVSLLEELGVSDRGIQFIKDLLVAYPKSRISASDAMQSSWILGFPADEYEIARNQFSKLGIHLNLRVAEKLFKQWGKLHKTETPKVPSTVVKGSNLFLCSEILKEFYELEVSELPPPMFKNPSALIYAAASKGYAVVIGIMICLIRTGKEGLDFRIDGWTALQIAARAGHIDVIKLLLEKGAKVNASPCVEGGRTALQAATQSGHLEVVRLLLDEKANINAKPSYNAGRGALQAAAQSGNLEVANLLLARGAEVNTPPCMIQGRTALQAAAENGQLELVRLLAEKGAKVNAEACDIGGRTALQAAAEKGHLGVVRLLLKRGADVNAEPSEIEGRTALQAAAEKGHLDMVKLLLEIGADANAEACSEEGVTALSAAMKGGYLEVEEVLRTAGAELCDD